jgi:hypothetical protein
VRFTCRNAAVAGKAIPVQLSWVNMEIIAIVIKVMEILFVAGGVGSTVVILLSGFEDIETVMEVDEPVSS